MTPKPGAVSLDAGQGRPPPCGARGGWGQTYTVEGGGGLRLHAREWGNPRGPAIFFIHGWSQSHLSWRYQFESEVLADEFRLVALDNRGHGMSEKPLEEVYYTDERLWTDNIAVVIAALNLDRPVLVG